MRIIRHRFTAATITLGIIRTTAGIHPTPGIIRGRITPITPFTGAAGGCTMATHHIGGMGQWVGTGDRLLLRAPFSRRILNHPEGTNLARVRNRRSAHHSATSIRADKTLRDGMYVATKSR